VLKVYSAPTLPDAHLVRGLLAQAGIDARMAVGVNRIEPADVGGVPRHEFHLAVKHLQHGCRNRHIGENTR